MIKEIDTYNERDKIFKENEIIARTFENNSQFDIISCTLLKDKDTCEYSVFLTTDSNDEWLFLTFDDKENVE